MTCIASFRREAGLALFRIPPYSRSVEATKTEDWPNFFSNFCWFTMLAFSFSAPAKNIARSDVSYKKNTRFHFGFWRLWDTWSSFVNFTKSICRGLIFLFLEKLLYLLKFRLWCLGLLLGLPVTKTATANAPLWPAVASPWWWLLCFGGIIAI